MVQSKYDSNMLRDSRFTHVKMYPVKVYKRPDEVTIMLRLSKGYKKPVDWSTGIVVKRKQWDKEFNSVQRHKDMHRLNAQIEEQARFLDDLFKEKVRDNYETGHPGLPDPDYLKKSMRERFRPTGLASGKKGIFETITEIIGRQKKLKLSFEKYESVGLKLAAYEKHIGKSLRWSDLTISEIHKIQDWLLLYGNAMTGGGLNENSAARIMTAFNRVIKVGYKNRYHNNNVHEEEDFSTLRQSSSQDVFNSLDELMKLYKVPDKKFTKPGQSLIRDYFLIGSFSGGARISDVQAMVDSVKGKPGSEYMTFIQQKTTTPVFVPIVQVVRDIFDRHEWNMPKMPVEQYFNREIKTIQKIAKIDYPVTIVRNKAGKDMKITKEKCEFIRSKNMRVNFCSNCRAAGMDYDKIRYYSGHETIAALKNYITKEAEMQYSQRMKSNDTLQVWKKAFDKKSRK